MDIVMKSINIDLAGMPILQDTDLTLVRPPASTCLGHWDRTWRYLRQSVAAVIDWIGLCAQLKPCSSHSPHCRWYVCVRACLCVRLLACLCMCMPGVWAALWADWPQRRGENNVPQARLQQRSSCPERQRSGGVYLCICVYMRACVCDFCFVRFVCVHVCMCVSTCVCCVLNDVPYVCAPVLTSLYLLFSPAPLPSVPSLVHSA